MNSRKSSFHSQGPKGSGPIDQPLSKHFVTASLGELRRGSLCQAPFQLAPLPSLEQSRDVLVSAGEEGPLPFALARPLPLPFPLTMGLNCDSALPVFFPPLGCRSGCLACTRGCCLLTDTRPCDSTQMHTEMRALTPGCDLCCTNLLS